MNQKPTFHAPKDPKIGTAILVGKPWAPEQMRRLPTETPMFHRFQVGIFFMKTNLTILSVAIFGGAWVHWESSFKTTIHRLPVELRSPVTDAWSLNREMAMQYKEVWTLRMAGDWLKRQSFTCIYSTFIPMAKLAHFSTSVPLVCMCVHGSIHGFDMRIVKVPKLSSQKYLSAMMRCEKIRLYGACSFHCGFKERLCSL